MDTLTQPRNRLLVRRARFVVIALAIVLAPWAVDTQVLDICGCGSIPNLPAFDSRDAATHPPGTVVSGSTVTLQYRRMESSDSAALPRGTTSGSCQTRGTRLSRSSWLAT